MSNLGLYQKLTTLFKKVGGPVNFLVLYGLGSYAVGRGAEVGIKKIEKVLGKVRNSKTIYHVLTEGVSNEGLEFKVNDEFRVLNRDKQAVQIEKIGDDNNPYFVAYDFLKSISDYK